jgi:hypothetical protein
MCAMMQKLRTRDWSLGLEVVTRVKIAKPQAGTAPVALRQARGVC